VATVVEIVPALVVEIVPTAVVEIVPARVVEMVPALVVEIVPPFAFAHMQIAKVRKAAKVIELTFFIVDSPGCETSGVWSAQGNGLRKLSLSRLKRTCVAEFLFNECAKPINGRPPNVKAYKHKVYGLSVPIRLTTGR